MTKTNRIEKILEKESEVQIPNLRLVVSPNIKKIEESTEITRLYEIFRNSIYKKENLNLLNKESTEIYKPKKSGFFGIDYNGHTKILTGYIVDVANPYQGQRFEAKIDNFHFGKNMQQYLKTLK